VINNHGLRQLPIRACKTACTNPRSTLCTMHRAAAHLSRECRMVNRNGAYIEITRTNLWFPHHVLDLCLLEIDEHFRNLCGLKWREGAQAQAFYYQRSTRPCARRQLKRRYATEGEPSWIRLSSQNRYRLSTWSRCGGSRSLPEHTQDCGAQHLPLFHCVVAGGNGEGEGRGVWAWMEVKMGMGVKKGAGWCGYGLAI